MCQQKNSDGAPPREEKACPHCLMTKNRPEMGLERADRFIHHLQWQHPSANRAKLAMRGGFCVTDEDKACQSHELPHRKRR